MSEPLTQKGPTARLDAENFCDVLDAKIDPTQENGEVAMANLRDLEKDSERKHRTEEVYVLGREEERRMEGKCEYIASW